MKRAAFTLIELLVVIAIIGMLVALLLPAIQSARESGRRITCANQFKQLGLACANHIDTHGWYPTGGWGWNWTGDPNRGFGRAQPAGWTYNILPFLEFNKLHDAGLGNASGTSAGFAKQQIAGTDLNKQVVSLYICPSRRSAILYPLTGAVPANSNLVKNSDLVAKCDYAISCGTGTNGSNPGNDQEFQAGATSYSQGDAPGAFWPDYSNANDPNFFQSGVSFVRSQVTPAQVTRGASHIIVLGEKSLDSVNYTSGLDGGDNEVLFVGQDNDTYRTTYYVPQADIANVTNEQDNFGSAHPGGCNFSAGDGSVHYVTYLVDPTTFSNFGVISAPLQDTIWEK